MRMAHARSRPLQSHGKHCTRQATTALAVWRWLRNVGLLVAIPAQQAPLHAPEAECRPRSRHTAPGGLLQQGGEESQQGAARMGLRAGRRLPPGHLSAGGAGVAVLPPPQTHRPHSPGVGGPRAAHQSRRLLAGARPQVFSPRSRAILPAVQLGGSRLHIPQLRGVPHTSAHRAQGGHAGGLDPLRSCAHHERRPRTLQVGQLVDVLPELPDRAPPVPLDAAVPPPTHLPARQAALRETRPGVRPALLPRRHGRDLQEPAQGGQRRLLRVNTAQ
mmetsp:Transcript_78585/g.169820  ORF Transcript_78585/g.169820 Transcript_78585/m.169820 type:complete len:274 (+) Transcript_78585:492-1313(+)